MAAPANPFRAAARRASVTRAMGALEAHNGLGSPPTFGAPLGGETQTR